MQLPPLQLPLQHSAFFVQGAETEAQQVPPVHSGKVVSVQQSLAELQVVPSALQHVKLPWSQDSPEQQVTLPPQIVPMAPQQVPWAPQPKPEQQSAAPEQDAPPLPQQCPPTQWPLQHSLAWVQAVPNVLHVAQLPDWQVIPEQQSPPLHAAPELPQHLPPSQPPAQQSTAPAQASPGLPHCLRWHCPLWQVIPWQQGELAEQAAPSWPQAQTPF